MTRALVVWVVLALMVSHAVASPVIYRMAHKGGRIDMYADICERLGVDENHYIRVGKHIFTPEGLGTLNPLTVPKDVCNHCHVGGI